jgi:hypothetical protein
LSQLREIRDRNIPENMSFWMDFESYIIREYTIKTELDLLFRIPMPILTKYVKAVTYFEANTDVPLNSFSNGIFQNILLRHFLRHREIETNQFSMYN